MAVLRLALVLVLAVAVPETATAGAPPSGTAWQAEHGRDHPLAGRIYDTAAEAFVAPADLVQRLRDTPIVLLGEVHDNPDHHALQGWIMRQTRGLGPRRAVVMEMIRAGQEPELKRFYVESEACCRQVPASQFFDFVKWSESGWPDARLYAPVVQAALDMRLEIFSGNPARATIRAVARMEKDALSAARRSALGLDRPLPPALADALTDMLKTNHCNALPDAAIPGMANAQRFRDGVMAEHVLGHGGRAGAYLVAGNGHVRSDRGVPMLLRRMRPDSRYAVVMFIEVADGVGDAAALIPRGPDGKAAADYVWFTPRAERGDPCAVFQKG